MPLSCAKMGSLRRVSSSALGPVSDCKQEKWTWSFVTRQSSQNKVSPTAKIVNCIHPNWFLYMAGGRSLRMICIYFFTARTRPLHQPQTARAYTLIRHLILTRPPALWIFRTAVSGTWGPRHSRTPSRSRGGPVTCNARNCNEGGHNHQDIVTVVTV